MYCSTAHFNPCCQTDRSPKWFSGLNLHLMLRIECWLSIESSVLVCVLHFCLFVISLRCLYMFIPCFPEILFLISCQLASIEAYKKMLNRNLIVWKDWNPVSWTSKARCPFWIQPSIERFEVFPSRRNNMPQSACSSHVSYWYRIGICWNVDAIPGNDGTRVLGWSRKRPTGFVSGSCKWRWSWIKMGAPWPFLAGAGESFGRMTAEYLHRLQSEKGIMLAVCTSDYGEMTDSPYSSFAELEYAQEYKLDVLPLQVEDQWKPNPACGEGHQDTKKLALAYISMVFKPSRVRVDCRNLTIEEIACKIAAVLRKGTPA